MTPNWFASVMGTGIVAVAAYRLPVQLPGQSEVALGVWALAAAMLVLLVLATAAHWVLYPENARQHLHDAVMAHFYGAPAMAFLTVGAGTLLVGRLILGRALAVEVDWALWFIGTAIGLWSSVVVPYQLFTRHQVRPDSAFGGWLMPIVPPMVSASTGALLVPFAAAGEARLDLLLACYAMFGFSLLASLIIITLIWHRLAVHKIGEARMVPTLWIVLGPLGQSVTAAGLLGGAAHLALPAAEAPVLQVLGLAYGVPTIGFALVWMAVAGAITLRTAREHLPFSLTWWSFTFPVGTCVTGMTGLALATHSVLLTGAAAALFVGLVAAWIVVFIRTAGGVVNGRLLLRPPAPAVADQRVQTAAVS